LFLEFAFPLSRCVCCSFWNNQTFRILWKFDHTRGPNTRLHQSCCDVFRWLPPCHRFQPCLKKCI
jgi:hypothetical protein